MKVKKLKELLKEYPDDFDVILSSDAEGNSYSPLADAGPGHYEPVNTYSGEWTCYANDDGEHFLSLAQSNSICLGPKN